MTAFVLAVPIAKHLLTNGQRNPSGRDTGKKGEMMSESKIEISRRKALSMLSNLSIFADSPYHAEFVRKEAKKDYNYLDKKLYPVSEES